MNRALLVLLVLAMAMLTACDLLARFDSPPPLPLVQADYPVCVRIEPGPMPQHHRPVFHPRNSELA